MSHAIAHEHRWRKTGEYFATNPPIWVYVCECRAVGEARDGDAVKVCGVWSEAEYQKYGGAARQTPEGKD